MKKRIHARGRHAILRFGFLVFVFFIFLVTGGAWRAKRVMVGLAAVARAPHQGRGFEPVAFGFVGRARVAPKAVARRAPQMRARLFHDARHFQRAQQIEQDRAQTLDIGALGGE